MTTAKIAIGLPKQQLARVHREVRRKSRFGFGLYPGAVLADRRSRDYPEQLARTCGELCGATHTADLIDASVVILARERGDRIVTSHPRDLKRLDPTCPIIPI